MNEIGISNRMDTDIINRQVKLDEDENYVAGYYQGRQQDYCFITIEGRYSSYGQDSVSLNPAQALELLKWLTQEKATIEQAAQILQEHGRIEWRRGS